MAVDENTQWGEWAAQAQSGDKVAYAQLLRALAGPIKSLIRQKIGSLANAEDLSQEALLAIHRSLHTYRAERSFRSWAFTIARYKVIDYLRERERKWSKEVEFTENAVTISSAQANSLVEPHAEHRTDDRIDQLGLALQGLSPAMRRAVEMTKLEGLSTAEAARREGISEVALRTRISRAYGYLRKSMERECG